LSFSHKDQASGEGGKSGLGNVKNTKNNSRFGKCKKITPNLGNVKKMPKNDS